MNSRVCVVSSYSTTEKLKLLSSFQDSNYNLGVFADYHGVRTANLIKYVKDGIKLLFYGGLGDMTFLICE